MQNIPDNRKTLTTALGSLVLLCSAGLPVRATELSISNYGVKEMGGYNIISTDNATSAKLDVSSDMSVCLIPDRLKISGLQDVSAAISITAWNTPMTGGPLTNRSYVSGRIINHCNYAIQGNIMVTTWSDDGFKPHSSTSSIQVRVPAAASCLLHVASDVKLTSTDGSATGVQLTSSGSGSCNIMVKPATADASGGTLVSTDGQSRHAHYKLTTGHWDAVLKKWTLPITQDSAVELFGPLSAGEYAGTATVTLVSE